MKTKALLFADNTLPLPVASICDVVNATCHDFILTPGSTAIRIDTSQMSGSRSVNQLNRMVKQEAADCEYVFICTAVPYSNNYFFESSGTTTVLSFAGWNLLTDLPIANGLIYFIASILCDLRGANAHQENTGCVNDFWWDKRGVDVGMRASFICANCRSRLQESGATLLKDAERLLDLVCVASRSNRDVLSIAVTQSRGTDARFDVFLCHNSDDKVTVRKINQDLRSAGIRTWFDEEQLEPGRLWQVELEQQFSEVRAACVFVGPTGRGPWQDMEIRAFLSEFVNRGCPVIPVLLEGAPDAPDLPLFLKQMMWVDLRSDYSSRMARLIGALAART